jgi:high frequency lysogenization protein
MDNTEQQVLALAGLFQACAMVEKLAKTGICPQAAYRCSSESLFVQCPEDTLSVYGSLGGLQFGLELLTEMLHDHRHTKQADALRYALGIMHLQKKLSKKPDMLNIMGARIEQASDKAKHFESLHENVIGNIADIYSDTISTFRYRIQVNGDVNLLQQQRVANQIRALLLAAVRSAMLWRQLGGNRFHLVSGRTRLLAGAEALHLKARKESL